MILESMYHTLVTTSPEETIGLGQRLGALLGLGDVVALTGTLGSGKTCFTKGLALGLGVPPDTVITSASFALVNEYQGRCRFFHMDLYRLTGPMEFASAGLEEFLFDGGVAAVEWADRVPEALPEQRIDVEFAIINDHRRQITLSGRHPRAVEMINSIAANMR
jgi:tRNA threonylcarbamoyladenosine biosynthesis protein TsaE